MRGGGVAVWVDKAILRSGVKRVTAYVYVGVRVEGRERDRKRRSGDPEGKRGGRGREIEEGSVEKKKRGTRNLASQYHND